MAAAGVRVSNPGAPGPRKPGDPVNFQPRKPGFFAAENPGLAGLKFCHFCRSSPNPRPILAYALFTLLTVSFCSTITQQSRE